MHHYGQVPAFVLAALPLLTNTEMSTIPYGVQDKCYLFILGTTAEFLYYSTFQISLDFMNNKVTASGETRVIFVNCMDYDHRTRRMFYTTHPFGSRFARRTIFYVDIKSDGNTTSPRRYYTVKFEGDLSNIVIDQKGRRLYIISTLSIHSISIDKPQVDELLHYEGQTGFLVSNKYVEDSLDFNVQPSGEFAFVANRNGKGKTGFIIQRIFLTQAVAQDVVTRHYMEFCGMTTETQWLNDNEVNGSCIYYCALSMEKGKRVARFYKTSLIPNNMTMLEELNEKVLYKEMTSIGTRPSALTSTENFIYAAVYFEFQYEGPYAEIWKIDTKGLGQIRKLGVKFNVFLPPSIMQLRLVHGRDCTGLENRCPSVTPTLKANETCSREHGAICDYQCLHSARKIGQNITCQSGFWQNTDVKCTTECLRNPPTSVNISETCSYSDKEMCSFSCLNGYRRTIVDEFIECRSGHWSTPLHDLCTMLCPKEIPNGVIEKTCSREEDADCAYSCADGFVATRTSLTCESNKNWQHVETELCSETIKPLVIVIPVLSALVVVGFIVFGVRYCVNHKSQLSRKILFRLRREANFNACVPLEIYTKLQRKRKYSVKPVLLHRQLMPKDSSKVRFRRQGGTETPIPEAKLLANLKKATDGGKEEDVSKALEDFRLYSAEKVKSEAAKNLVENARKLIYCGRIKSLVCAIDTNDKKTVDEKIELLRKASYDMKNETLEQARKVSMALATIDSSKLAIVDRRLTIDRIGLMLSPPPELVNVLQTVLVLLGNDESSVLAWSNCKKNLKNMKGGLTNAIQKGDMTGLRLETAERAYERLSNYKAVDIYLISNDFGKLFDWTRSVCLERLNREKRISAMPLPTFQEDSSAIKEERLSNQDDGLSVCSFHSENDKL